MMKNATLILAIFISIFLSSCVKQKQYPIIPAIQFLHYNRTVINAPGDTFLVTLSFTDGDGDVGPMSADTANSPAICDPDSLVFKYQNCNIFYKDLRDNCMQFLSTVSLDNSSSYKSISGELDLKLSADYKKCLDPNVACNDSISYEIIMRDRAGHFSNKITTPIIILKR